MPTSMPPGFLFLRIDRAGPSGVPVSECSLLDVGGSGGDPVAMSSFLTAGLPAHQADRLEEMFRSAGVEIRRQAEPRERRERAAKPDRVHAGNPEPAASAPSLFPDADG